MPRVSIVTPVYNGEKYLAECIDSVLSQTFQDWDYTIVNNCSTDRTREIVESYAARDSRIKVRNNEEFVGLIENHNNAFRCISSAATYCKLVSADDWLYPECLERLVDVGEKHPTTGVIGSFSLNPRGIKFPGLPYTQTVYDGRLISRQFFRGAIDTFWVPSTVLYRASLVAATSPFFPGSAPSADLAACLGCLRTSDFGFVHQILSFERIHDESDSSRVRREGSYLLDRLEILREFGPAVLNEHEYAERMDAILDEYYGSVLAPAVFSSRPRGFWNVHRARLRELDLDFFGTRLTKAVALRFLDLCCNPKQTAEKFVRRRIQRSLSY